jgi:hypothetical protein
MWLDSITSILSNYYQYQQVNVVFDYNPNLAKDKVEYVTTIYCECDVMKVLTLAKQGDIPPLIALCCFHLACSLENFHK